MDWQPLDFERPIFELERRLEDLKNHSDKHDVDLDPAIKTLEAKLRETRQQIHDNLTAWQRVQIARHTQRPFALDYIERCFTNWIELHGDRRFADDTVKFLQTKGSSSPELKAYVDSLEQIVQQIPQEYSVQKENMKSPEHASELTRQTIALTASKSTNNLPAYMELLKAWRAMGGAQDYLVAQCHTITRKLFQEAGYGCVNDPNAVLVAEEVRARCRQVLRNPDGYEIWADY